MTYLSNAFSLQMLPTKEATIRITPATPTQIVKQDFVSVIGHKDTAAVVSNLLGVEVECNRQSVTLEENDTLFVAQVMGGRLPEGATTIPEGMRIEFLEVYLI